MSDHKLSLLLVDDEPFILKGLETTFDWDSYGYHISGTARDGLMALKKIRENIPDVILTDVCMKNMDGISLIRKCALLYPSIKFVILSAHQEFSYAKSACELGVYCYLLKPISETQLESTMINLYDECITNIEQKKYIFSDAFKLDDNNRVEKIGESIDYIAKNLSDPKLSLAQVANILHYNYNYFGRLFRSAIGISFKDYVCKLRLKRATQLLVSHDMSIIDIACLIGIPNQSYFCSLFKNEYKMTPSQYRKNI